MSMGQPHQSNVNYCVYLGWAPKPGRAPSGVRTGNLPILNETPYPTTLFFPDFFLMLYYGTRHGELKIKSFLHLEVNPFKFKYETVKYKLEIINKIIA